MVCYLFCVVVFMSVHDGSEIVLQVAMSLYPVTQRSRSCECGEVATQLSIISGH